jgi:hypothetical protein
MGMLKADKSAEARIPSGVELLERMGKFMNEIAAAGVFSACECERASSQGACVRLSGGKLTVTEGPFPETKEPVASYAMFDVASIVEAVEWTMSFLKVLGEGECEIRPVFEPSDFAVA